jgi:two-component system LytT family response regulator
MSLRVFILEDEAPAVAQLERMLLRWDASTVIAGVAESVRDGVAWLRAHPEPDLVLADLRLSDGLSLRVFDEVQLACPVIFTTAHDDYVMKAMERNAIDYLLKPIEAGRLALSLEKYRRLRDHFGGKLAALARELAQGADPPMRVLARRGAGFVAVPLERVAWFTTEHKQTVLVDRQGTRLLVDEGLADLEARLGARVFRLNRQYLARADAIVGFVSAGRGRLLVTLEPRSDDDVLVSQEAAAAFRGWIAR